MPIPSDVCVRAQPRRTVPTLNVDGPLHSVERALCLVEVDRGCSIGGHRTTSGPQALLSGPWRRCWPLPSVISWEETLFHGAMGPPCCPPPIGSSSARLAIDWEEPPPNPARGSAQAAASDERVVRETGGLHLNLAARNVIGHTPCPLVLSRPSCATGNTRLQYVFSDQRGGSSSFQFGI